MVTQSEPAWVLLSYRVPREPSTPRIAVWRRLKELGVAQIGDGLVGLPLTQQTEQSLERVAAQVLAANGQAIVWSASPRGERNHVHLKRQLVNARSDEYRSLLREVETTAATSGTVERWRTKWRAIDLRDHYHAPKRDEARQAISRKARDLEPISA